jgi:hypothetical protein
MVRSEGISEILAVLGPEYEWPELLDEHSADRNGGGNPVTIVELGQF